MQIRRGMRIESTFRVGEEERERERGGRETEFVSKDWCIQIVKMLL